jgi:ElaB/YqjD/DUF883 family membrane-anchored ribosome-binding protein
MPVESQPITELDPKDQAALSSAESRVRSVNDDGLSGAREIKARIMEALRQARKNPETKEEVLERIQEALDRVRDKLASGALTEQERRVWEELQEALDGAGGTLSTRVRGKAAERFYRPSPATLDKIYKAGRPDEPKTGFHAVPEEIPKGMTVDVYQDKVRSVYQDSRWDRKYASIVEEFYGGKR